MRSPLDGVQVVLLEASDRIGGRVHSSSIALNPHSHVTVECGAEFGHGLLNSRLKEILDELGMQYDVRSWPDRIWTGRKLWDAQDAEEAIPDIAAANAFFAALPGLEPRYGVTSFDLA